MSERKKNRKISIGMENFKRIIDDNGYFVDKTLMIKDIIESNAVVTLFTRPRRFGKTLNQSMLRYFFEDTITEKGERIDNGYLFDELAVSRCGDDIMKHRGRYPVISLTLKSAKQPDFEMAYNSLVDEICKEFQRHIYILSGDMPERNHEKYRRITLGRGSRDEYAKSIGFLSECLARYHGRSTLILIDEYDVPLENAYFRGFYDDMIAFVRSLFESALKTNDYLYKGVITGCLRISRESIFTGLNNLEVDTVLHSRYGECFGFTQSEVEEMLEYYQLEDYIDEVRSWYDGYRFGTIEIYNPWSILKYVVDHIDHVTRYPLPYWSNTSSNSIVRELVYDADEETRNDLEILMDGGTIEKPVHEDITYGDIHTLQDNLWNFLFFTGYLKYEGERMEGTKLYLSMSIPNVEIMSIYENSISSWFDEKIEKLDRSPLIKALETGDCETAEEFISGQLLDTISCFDYAESYYHGFMTGILKGSGKYRVLSNRESGSGRPDIILKTPRIRRGRAMILEFKIADDFHKMEIKCDEALQQIETRNYESSLRQEGYEDIMKYGICFCRKECMVKKAEPAV